MGWTAMLLSPGLRAVYVVVLLVLIGLAVVIIMRFKKKGETTLLLYCCCAVSHILIQHVVALSVSLIFAGNTIMEQHAPAWGDRENPAFDFKT